MTALTWSGLEASVAAALVQAPSPYTTLPADFTQLFPNATSYAESRIARDLVLVNTRTTNTSLTTTAATRSIAIGGLTQPLIVLEQVSLVVSGVTVPFLKASRDLIDFTWPQQALTSSPTAVDISQRFWTLLNDVTLIIAPTPDQAYQAALTGLFIQTPMSASNTTTYIGNTYGDAMFALVMKWMSGGLLRNYGAAADESPQAQSWEKVYQDMLPGMKSEEARRRGLVADDETARKE